MPVTPEAKSVPSGHPGRLHYEQSNWNMPQFIMVMVTLCASVVPCVLRPQGALQMLRD